MSDQMISGDQIVEQGVKAKPSVPSVDGKLWNLNWTLASRNWTLASRLKSFEKS